MTQKILDELEMAENAFNAAMISNDPLLIRNCISPDWVLVTPESGPVSADAILNVIGSGILGHYTMTKTTHHVKIMGDVATVTGRGQNTGWFRDAELNADEWITDVYHRIKGEWRCVLTHLTTVCDQ